jgi:hypothetical protein
MRIILKRRARNRDILEALNTTTFLDVICEISTGTILHYQINVLLRAYNVD